MSSKVVIGYCHSEHVAARFHQAITHLLISPHATQVIDLISIVSSPRIASTRNQIVNAFLKHPSAPEWLWMLDADMVFTPDTLLALLDVADPTERPIVGGLYFGGRIDGKITPHAYVLSGDGGGLSSVQGVGAPGQWGPIIRVHGTGAGCLLMHRSVLEAIGAKYRSTGFPWFAETGQGGEEYGEDITFCLRAHALDIPIHVHTGVILGHVKTGIVDEQSYLDYLDRRERIGDEGIDKEFIDRSRVTSLIIKSEREEDDR